MMASLGEAPDALGVARRYAAAGLLDVFVLDRSDEALAGEVRALGLDVVVTDTVMVDASSRARLAREMLAAAPAAPAARAVGAVAGGSPEAGEESEQS
jgi:LPPG:FO 2-phospho-L-lactate transferase